MTVTALVQLYAPFAGLMALAFWMGMLTQRVRQLEKDCNRGDLVTKVAELTVKLDYVEKHVASIDAAMQGVNRQLGNIAMGRVGMAVEIPKSKDQNS